MTFVVQMVAMIIAWVLWFGVVESFFPKMRGWGRILVKYLGGYLIALGISSMLSR